MASSPGRPSLRKNEPGIWPTAYIRSSTSIVRGKKSNWSLGVLPAVVADRSIVSSSRYAVTEPAAWRASRPVSNLTVRVPNLPLSITVSTAEMIGFGMRLSHERLSYLCAERSRDMTRVFSGCRSSIEIRRARARHMAGAGSEDHYRGPEGCLADRSCWMIF